MKCEKCRKSVLLAYQCRYCARYFCGDHKEAPAHDCPNASPSEGARLNCLGDVDFARNYQLLSLFLLVIGTIGIMLTWIPWQGQAVWFWGLPIVMVVGGLIGLCFYTYRVHVRRADLKRMVFACPKCGKQIRGDYMFCAFCSYRLPNPSLGPDYTEITYPT